MSKTSVKKKANGKFYINYNNKCFYTRIFINSFYKTLLL